MVNSEQDGVAFACRGAQIDRRLPAIGADLEERTHGRRGEPRVVEREALIVRHEAQRGAGVLEQVGIHGGGQIIGASVYRPNTSAKALTISPSVASPCTASMRAGSTFVVGSAASARTRASTLSTRSSSRSARS